MELILKIYYLIIPFCLFLFRPACQRELNDLRSARSGAELKHGLLRIYNLCKYIIINKLFIYFKKFTAYNAFILFVCRVTVQLVFPLSLLARIRIFIIIPCFELAFTKC